MLLDKGADVTIEDRTYGASAKASSVALYKNVLQGYINHSEL